MPSSNTNLSDVGRRSILGIRALSLIAIGVSGHLSLITVTHGTLAACGELSSHIACDHVLRSAWSRWMGIPVSIFGCIVYISILISSYWITASASERFHSIAHRVFVGLVTMAAASALWFLSLQVFVIGKLCLFCVSIHLCGIAIAIILIVSGRRQRRQHQGADYITILQHAAIGNLASTSATFQDSNQQTHWRLLPCGAAMLGMLLLVVGQVFFPAKTFEVSDGAEFMDADMGHVLGTLNAVAPVRSTTETSQIASVPNSATDSSLPEHRVNSDSEPQHSAPVSRVASALTKESGPESDSKKMLSREIALLKGKFKIDVYRHGLMGSPQAEHVIVELVDYTCKDCRRLHQHFKQVRKRYNDRLAIVVLPVPLETSCNPHLQRTHPSHVGACKYARLALAVLDVDDKAFVEFHDWLMESPYPPSLQDAKSKATQLVDADQLELAIIGERVSKRLRAHVRLFRRIGRFPAMIVRDHVVVGVPASAADLNRVIEKRLGIADRES